MRRAIVLLVLLAACVTPPRAGPTGPETPSGASVRLLFAGDVMLGRGVAALVAGDDGSALFEGVRPVISSADLAMANLESPLTDQMHLVSSGPNALEADPAAAGWLADAGFDAMSVANNHAGDAGPATVPDTLDALHDARVHAVGGGEDADDAFAPTFMDVEGVTVALLAFDATGQGSRAAAGAAGVAWWDPNLVRRSVTAARAAADIVAVAIHGGTEYVPARDAYLWSVARQLATWGVDVVWGHGPHVVQPIGVIDPDGDGRPTVVATSLGNLLFDQHIPGTREGALLEVLVGPGGALAFRVGRVEHPDGPVTFDGWRAPRADAVALDGAWWTPVSGVKPIQIERPAGLAGFHGDVVNAALGDADGDGRREVVVAFRRPFEPTNVNVLLPRRIWRDALGRTAHVGVYRPRTLRPEWVAGTLVRPVGSLAVCDGSLAVSYTALDDPAPVAAGAWIWREFGFRPLPDLERPGIPACADVDGDGRVDPLVLRRSS